MTETAPETTDTAQAPEVQDTAVTETTEAKAPPESWLASLPEAMRDNASLTKFTSVEALAGSYINASKMLGADKVAIPKGEEGWDAFYKAGGRPDEATGYELKAPEGLPEGFYNSESADWFKGVAHQAGLNKQQAQTLHDEFVKTLAAGNEVSEAQLAEGRASAEAALRKEWGGSFDARLQSAADIMAELGGEEFGEFLVSSGLGNDPRMIRTAAKVAEALKGDTSLVGEGSTGASLADIDGQIAEYRTGNATALHDKMHPDHKRIVEGLTNLYNKRYPTEAA